MMVSLGLFCLLITGGGFCEEEEEEDQQQEVVGEEEKNQGIKVYGMCIPPIISCHLCTHFLYKDTTTTFQGKRDKKKGEKEKEKLGEEEKKKCIGGGGSQPLLCLFVQVWRLGGWRGQSLCFFSYLQVSWGYPSTDYLKLMILPLLSLSSLNSIFLCFFLGIFCQYIVCALVFLVLYSVHVGLTGKGFLILIKGLSSVCMHAVDPLLSESQETCTDYYVT